MSETTNCEKLAGIMNRASQDGKQGFVKMLWNNQPETVQSQLKPLLNAQALQVLETPPQ